MVGGEVVFGASPDPSRDVEAGALRSAARGIPDGASYGAKKMHKNILNIVVISLTMMALLVSHPAAPQEQPSPITYFVTGSLQMGESAQGVPLTSAQIILYQTPQGAAVIEPLNPSFSNSGTTDRFMINGMDHPAFSVGQTFNVAVARFFFNSREYGSTPQSIAISGNGFDECTQAVVIESIQVLRDRLDDNRLDDNEKDLIGDLAREQCNLTEEQARALTSLLPSTLTTDAIQNVVNQLRAQFPDISEDRIQCVSNLLTRIMNDGFTDEEKNRILPPDPPASAFGPDIESIIVDGREYTDAIVTKYGNFYAARRPTLQATYRSGWGIDPNSIGINIQGKEVQSRTLTVSVTSVSPAQASRQLDTGEFTALSLSHSIGQSEELQDGIQELVFRAANRWGQTTRVATVTVTSHIDVRNLVVTPVPFRSSRGADTPLQIAYTLTTPTDVEIIIYGVDGQIIQRFTFDATQNGGLADYNTVTWNGQNARGETIANGIYVGMILNRDSGKLLQKFRFVVKD